MGRKSDSKIVNVALNGRLVGRLEPGTGGHLSFRYDSAWLGWEHATPVSLFLPLDERIYSAARVWPVFDNLLPDNGEVRRKISQLVNVDHADIYSLLSEIGRDCVGALQFLPEDSPIQQPELPQGNPLSPTELSDRIRQLSTAPLGIIGGENDFRVSVPGFQMKTAFLFHNGKWLEPTGATPTTHILKPQIGKRATSYGELDHTESVQNEHFCMTLCRLLGLDVADTKIVKLDDDLHVLCIKRFDRMVDGKGRILRLPQEDMCQAHGIPLEMKYENRGQIGIQRCVKLLESSDNAVSDTQNFLKAQVILWVIGSIDGHAKNYSIFLRPRNRFAMTPFYDITSDQWQRNIGQIRSDDFRLSMKVGNRKRYKIDSIKPRHFAQTVTKVGFPLDVFHDVLEEIASNLDSALEATMSAVEGEVSEEMISAIAIAARRRAMEINAYLSGIA